MVDVTDLDVNMATALVIISDESSADATRWAAWCELKRNGVTIEMLREQCAKPDWPGLVPLWDTYPDDEFIEVYMARWTRPLDAPVQ